MTLTLNIEPTLEMRIRHEAAKRGLDVNTYVVHAVQESLRRDQQNAPPRLSEEESQLLQEINRSLPPETWQRYRILIDKRRDEHLTPDEQSELIRISDQLEQLNTSRIAPIVALAHIRHLPVRDVMQQLGLTPVHV